MLQIPKFQTLLKTPCPENPAELSNRQFLARRLGRPATYQQVIKQAIDSTVKWPKVDAIIESRAQQRGEAFRFVQVGAKDGQRADPIHRHLKKI